eukprot:TRINITY_DN309_c0_g1_i1.p1 TRINITY_DN309_c0_g1~~TRINITY_DN309_c0_g1_i1.p1  ORF type:complete len:151 (-),score=27.71 TRINITY_DN309_c0_g1_i1:41-493(-)
MKNSKPQQSNTKTNKRKIRKGGEIRFIDGRDTSLTSAHTSTRTQPLDKGINAPMANAFNREVSELRQIIEGEGTARLRYITKCGLEKAFRDLIINTEKPKLAQTSQKAAIVLLGARIRDANATKTEEVATNIVDVKSAKTEMKIINSTMQ